MLGRVDLILEELDRQAGELARIARGIDIAEGPESRVELEVGRFLQESMDQLYAEWGENAPPGWLDDRARVLTRVGAQKQALLFLARILDARSTRDLEKEVERMLTSAREAMPTAIAVKFHEAPLVYTPDAMESEFSGLIFETHDAALQLLRDQLDDLERKVNG